MSAAHAMGANVLWGGTCCVHRVGESTVEHEEPESFVRAVDLRHLGERVRVRRCGREGAGSGACESEREDEGEEGQVRG